MALVCRPLVLLLAALAFAGLALGGCGSSPGGGASAEPGTITGRLVDAQDPDLGIADAFIYVPPIGSRASTRQANAAEATTDADGRYTLTGLPEGLHHLVVEPASGGSYSRMELPAQVGVSRGLSLHIAAANDALLSTVTTIEVSPTNIALQPGGTQQLSATVRDADGAEVTAAVTWLVIGGIGAIAESGLLTAGDAAASGAVIATLGGVTSLTSVTVGDPPANSAPTVTVTASDTIVDPGDVVTLTADGSDPDGDALSLTWFATGAPIDGAGASVAWTAPTRAGTHHVTCLVFDGRGGQASAGVRIRVRTQSSGFVRWDGSEYRLWGEEGTWAQAQAAAGALGAHLVVLGSEAEERFVRDTFGEDELWIGFTDSEDFSASEGNWAWVNREAAEYTNWAGGQPNDRDGQDFALMNWRGLFQWNDQSESRTTDAVFERAGGATDGGDDEGDDGDDEDDGP